MLTSISRNKEPDTITISSNKKDTIDVKNFIEKAREGGGFHYYNQLGNIITLELTMRYASIYKTSFNIK